MKEYRLLFLVYILQLISCSNPSKTTKQPQLVITDSNSKLDNPKHVEDSLNNSQEISKAETSLTLSNSFFSIPAPSPKIPLDSLVGVWYGNVDYGSITGERPSEEETWTISIDSNKKLTVKGLMDEGYYKTITSLAGDSVLRVSSVRRHEIGPDDRCWSTLRWYDGVIKGIIKRDMRLYEHGVSKGLVPFEGKIILSKDSNILSE